MNRDVSLIPTVIPEDKKWMARAIRLSHRGFTAPNPHVGCVIVKNDYSVGEGFHAFAGGPHAEIVALKKAGLAAEGSTVYVTLEPCDHYGRTPPCSKALIEAGVSRVVIAVPEPNQTAAGGSERLRGARIEVVEGVLAEEAWEANKVWLTAIRRQRPYVLVKVGCSLDGRIALANGESQWITSEASRKMGHRLRAEMGAILVGRRTAELDHPSLTSRIRGVRNPPNRIVIDPEGKLGPTGNLKDPLESDLIIHRVGIGHGIELLNPDESDFENISRLLTVLFDHGVRSLMIEGGSNTISRFIQSNFVDRIELFVSGKMLFNGLSWLQGPMESLALAPHWRFLKIQKIGADVRVILEPDETAS